MLPYLKVFRRYLRLQQMHLFVHLCPTIFQDLWFHNGLWGLRDFCIIGIAALLSVVIMVYLGIFIPAAITLVYGFLTIRMDDTTVMDYIRYAVKYFITTQQYYEWR